MAFFRAILGLFVSGLWVFFPPLLYADEIEVGFGFNKPPFVVSDTDSGIEIDIVRRALTLKGHTLKVRYISNAELNMQLQNKKSTIEASATINERYQLPDIFYSDVYIRFENVAISLDSNHFQINKIEELTGLKVIGWQLARDDLGDDFKFEVGKLGRHNYFEYTDQSKQNEAFWRGLADVIVVDKTIFRRYVNLLADKYDTSSPVIYHDIFAHNTFYRMGFKNKQHRDDFNQGLKMLRDSGSYNDIYSHYIAAHE